MTMTKMLKRKARALFSRLGYDVSPRGARYRLGLLDSIDKVITRNSVDLVFDVGANVGQFAQYLRTELSYRGRIISFEPSPEVYRECLANAEDDPNWTVYPWGLGAEQATLELNVFSTSDMSSFKPSSAGNTPFNDAKVTQTISVPVKTLDETVAELGLVLHPQSYIIKCDTQGFDLEVFRGGRTTVSNAAALLTEVSQIQIYDGVPDFLDAIAELRGYGFEVASLTPVTFHGMAALEFDCLMVKKAKH